MRKQLTKVMTLLLCLNGASFATEVSADIGTISLPQPQQSGTVLATGVVSEPSGSPIIGATVTEKGTKNVTVTDIDGRYSLNVHPGATLEISYMGFTTQRIKAGENARVTLEEETSELNEVVVVGYGTQKKVNLSGSVSSVNVEELTKSRPVTNVSQALGGLAAGVSVISSSNRPGAEGTTIRVRGQGTLNSSSPLVIIDGVEADLSTVNPQDIESMSILKDAASSAIYGSRAANGVILVTTKNGSEGKMKLEYNGYVSFQSIRKTLTPVSNYADYMELINEGLANSGISQPYSQESIEAWRNDNGKNPLLYPNTDWIDATFKNSTATNHVISVSGGSKGLRAYASLGYMNDPGVMYNSGYSKYNGRFNVMADVKPWLSMGFQISGYVGNRQPGYAEIDNVFTYAAATTPGMVFRASDGRFGAMNNEEDPAQSANNNPLIRAYKYDGKYRITNFHPRFTATLKPLKGLSLQLSYSYEFTDYDISQKPVTIEGWNFLTGLKTFTTKSRTYLHNSDSKTEYFSEDAILRYENKFFDKRLDLKAMVGLSSELYRSKGFSVMRYDLLSEDIEVINGATGESSGTGSKTEWAMQSVFSRINLGWDDKYLLEVNFRGDGSSRFRRGKRWGYFPSASVAWRMDQEPFMKDALNGNLSNLKIRLSYGALGNNSVGNYDYLSLYTGGYNYSFNNSLATGMVINAISNSELTWEKTYVFDVGLDFGFFNNRLTGTFDYFNKRTVDILINLPAPYVHGTSSLPKQNSATVVNNGVELTLGWNDKIGDFRYGVTGNMTYVTNKVTKYKGKGKDGMSISGANLIWEGHSINSQYLLKVDRIIQTDEDLQLVQDMIDNAPVGSDGKKVNPFASYGTPEKGDFLYKDTNGDGIIDPNDRVICSDGPNPKFYFGMNLTADWHGIDFSMLLQGVLGVKTFWQHSGYNTPTVRYGYQLNKEVADGRWYEGRTDASYPRLLNYLDTRNTQYSDFYLENKAFLKIRNIQLGYTLPSRISHKFFVDKLRVYGSLENFFTFTSYDGLDPEVSGMNYPSMKQAVVGINITF